MTNITRSSATGVYYYIYLYEPGLTFTASASRMVEKICTNMRMQHPTIFRTKSSKKESHQRHHIFDENYANVIRRKHSYGVNYFKRKTIEQLCFRLQKHFLFQMLDPKYPATGLRIHMMRCVQTNSCLYKLFCRNQTLSLNYSAYLLLNEALAFIVACYKNITYLKADEGCRETEVEIRDLIRKTRKNLCLNIN